MSANLFIKNFDQFKSELASEDRRRIKAAQTAAKVEGYRLMRLLKTEIRESAPGGEGFRPLSEMARALRGRGRRSEQGPLYRLASPVRYDVGHTADGGMVFRFGYVEHGKRPTSASWRGLALLHQAGRTMSLSDMQRRAIIQMGVKLRKRGDEKARVFFLRKATQQIEIPRRPIIEPFWRAHETEAGENIVANFSRKMMGHRI